jgi:hypothetical protein
MSEYVTVETRPTDDPIAQMLFSGIAGIRALTITEHSLLITRDPDTPWEDLVDEVRDALRDFFL